MGNHVLIPFDGSDPAQDALDYAAEQINSDRLTVLHVVDPVEDMFVGMEGGYYSQDVYDQAIERGTTLCDQAEDRLHEAGVPDSTTIETEVKTGKPARTIIEFATEHDVDQIVMGSHGRSGISRLLLGSVAESVVRRAPVPVTVVR